jgi:hypothetical protein
LLADTELSITAIHGKAKPKELAGVETIIFPVFHPAAALYTPANRQVLVDDFGRLRRLLEKGVETLAGSSGVTAGGDAQAGPGDGDPAGGRRGVAAQPGAQPGPSRTEQLHLW